MSKKPPYVEVVTTPTPSLAIQICRHLQSRQYLGSAVIICSDAHAMLSAVRKQWVKTTRHLQSLRASTLNPEEILRLTHIVMHMQHMQFVAKPPQDNPHATVYFVTPSEAKMLPTNCYSLYIAEPCTHNQLAELTESLPHDALVITYVGNPTNNLRPKHDLEQQLQGSWQQMRAFLEHAQIFPERLVVGTSPQTTAMDEALDTLLTKSSDFLRHAAGLRQALSLAQPLSAFTPDEQRQFEVIIRLAHRVQALSPGSFNSYLLHVFGESEATTYFLREGNSEAAEELYH